MPGRLGVDRIEVDIEDDLARRFSGLRVLAVRLDGFINNRYLGDIESLESRVYSEVRRRHSLESPKDVAVFRAYRDFFWELGIDPTKLRPSSEALVRRILMGKGLPRINPLVDAYNLASALTGITMAAYDDSKVSGSLRIRRARPGEAFRGIGMDEEIRLGSEVVLRDDVSILSIYPYRDSDHTKTGEDTRRAILVTCGVPGISFEILREAEKVALDFIESVATPQGESDKQV